MRLTRFVLACVALIVVPWLGACGTAGRGDAGGGDAVDTDPEPIACGSQKCDPATQYCLHVVYQADCVGQDAFTCTDLPARCGGAPSCDCIPHGSCDFGGSGESACDDKGGAVFVCNDGIC